MYTGAKVSTCRTRYQSAEQTGGNLFPTKGFIDGHHAQYPELIQKKINQWLLEDIPLMASSVISNLPDAANYMANMFLCGEISSLLRIEKLGGWELNNQTANQGIRFFGKELKVKIGDATLPEPKQTGSPGGQVFLRETT